MKLNTYPDILTIEDLMDILLIGRNQAYALLKNGTIKAFKTGNKSWKIPKESVEVFIRKH